MRSIVVCASFVVVCACNTTFSNPPPADRFYFPSAVAHVDVAGSDSGVLFVANANGDRRYSSGSVAAVNLDEVALPAFGTPVNGSPTEVTALGTVARASIDSFSGEMGVLARGGGKVRLFIPARSDDKVDAVDAQFDPATGVKLSCFPAASGDDPTNCVSTAASLSPRALEKTAEGVPRAFDPFGVSVKPRSCTHDADCGGSRTCVPESSSPSAPGVCLTPGGETMADVYVTHLQQVDSPLGSLLNYRSYLARLESDQMTVDASNFINIGYGAGSSAATGARWTYVTGRVATTPASSTPTYGSLLRLVDRNGTVLTTGLEGSFSVYQSRGIAVGKNEERLFIVGQSPDVLIVVGIASPQSDAPGISLIHSVPLPSSPGELVVIPREGRGDLVAITSEGTYGGDLMGELAIYDDGVGELVAHVPAVGIEPSGIAVDRRGRGARLYLSNYGDGRVAVVDIPDLAFPQDARLVAHLGQPQFCLTRSTQTAGCGVTQ